MSGRLSRRLQRQQEELAKLQALSTPVPTAEEADPVEVDTTETEGASVAPSQGFASEDSDHDTGTPAPAAPAPTSSSSKKKRKKKNKKPAQTDVNDMSLEAMDALLTQEMGHVKGRESASAAPRARDSAKTPWSVLRGTLVLDAAQLDPSLELKRQFGAAAIKAYERERQAPAGRSGARRDNRGAHLNSNLRARTVLCTPKATWPDLARSFVGMSMTLRDRAQGRMASWEHSRAYKQAQLQFTQAVHSHDTNALYALMRVFPWHIDTLLQLSDIARYQGDLGQASDFIDRAMFAMERSAAPSFVSSLTSSTGPLLCDFARAENRAFWLAAHRNIDLFGRRGTWRTALEWCKLVLSMDVTDPHGLLLWIDFLAIKAQQSAWLLSFLDALDGYQATTQSTHLDNVRALTPLDHLKGAAKEAWQGTLDWSVGLCFARALAWHASGDTEAADAALRLAIARHPRATVLLADKVEISVDADAVRAFSMRGSWTASDPAFDELLAHLYVHRSQSLWKDPKHQAWLRRVAQETLPSLVGAQLTSGEASDTTRLGVYRHVLVADLPAALHQQLMRYLPPAVRDPPGGMDTFDPLPPERGTRYDEAYYGALLPAMGHSAAAGPTHVWDLLQHLQHLGVNDIEQLLDHVDAETRDALLQVAAPLMAAEGEEDSPAEDTMPGTHEDSVPGHATDHADDDAEGPAAPASTDSGAPASEQGLLRRAWQALWGA